MRACVCVCVWGVTPCTWGLLDSSWVFFSMFSEVAGGRGAHVTSFQRSWVTFGKDIDQGRLIYVPANSCDYLLFCLIVLGLQL